MNVRTIKMETDYQMVCDWWMAHEWPPVPACTLPKNGLVVEEDGKPLAAGFLYGTDSDLCSIEWIVSNPEAPILARGVAVKKLVKSLTELGQKMGYGVIMGWLLSKSLMRVYSEEGYLKGDEGLTNMFKRFQ